MLGIGLLVPKSQVAPNGSPDPHASDTEPGNPPPVGMTFAVKFATPPAITVAAEGARMLTVKSLTVAFPLIDGRLPPVKLSTALLPSESGPVSTFVGAVTLTVTCAAKPMVVVVVPPDVVVVVGEVGTTLKVQVSWADVPLALEHVTEPPPVATLPVAVAAPEFAPSVSVNTTPGTGSPVL